MNKRLAILKSSGRQYIVTASYKVGSKEENEALLKSGKIAWNPKFYDKVVHTCFLDRNGEEFGRVQHFSDEQLTFIN